MFPRHPRWLEAPFALIALAALAVILYGTLYPFDFHSARDATGPFQTLFSTWRNLGRRGDVIANILLYFPLGFFLIQSLRRAPGFRPVVVVTLAAMALSTSIELLQVYDDGRQSALSDVYANTTGALLGAATGVTLYRRFRLGGIGRIPKHPFPALLLACWLGYRLFPYVPVIDLHKYWHAVKPLLTPSVPAPDLYRHTVIGLVVALLLEALVGQAIRLPGGFSRILPERWSLALLLPAVLAARVFIGEIILSPAEVAGGALAIAIWVGFLWRLRGRAGAIAVLFTIVVVIQALDPFHFSVTARAFEWVPFRSFLRGSLAVNAASFLEKAFTYGALVWLAVRAGCAWGVATMAGAALVFCLRLAQIYIPGRSAEITDAVILLMASATLRLLSRGGSVGKPPES